MFELLNKVFGGCDHFWHTAIEKDDSNGSLHIREIKQCSSCGKINHGRWQKIF